MNKLLKYIYGTGIAMFAVTAFSLTSCEGEEDYGKEIKGSPENFVYINTQTSAALDVPKNGVLFMVTNTPIGSLLTNKTSQEVKVSFVVQCSRLAATDIHAQLALDNSILLEGYNALPTGFTAALNKTEVLIPQNANISDSIVLSLNSSDLRPLEAGKKYMLPVVKIVSATNASVGENPSLVHTIIDIINFTNSVQESAATSVGTLVNKTGLGWVATATNASGANLGTNVARIVDNTTTTSQYYQYNPATYPFTLLIDTKAQRTVKGFSLINSSASYAVTSANVYTSANGIDYTFQGRITLSAAAQQHIRFYQPVANCQYVKLEYLTGTTQQRIVEFQLYE